MASLIIRTAGEEDYPFILDSWLNSHCESKIYSPFIPRDMYFKLHRPIVEAIMTRPGVSIHVAVNKEDPSLIYGYAIFEEILGLIEGNANIRIFHYVYVKRAFNGFGICKTLVNSAPFPLEKVFITHLTHRGRQILGGYDFTYCFYFLYPVKNYV